MSARRDVAELRAIAAALRGFATHCEELLSLIADGQPLGRADRERATLLYSSLRRDLQDANARGKPQGNFASIVDAELAQFAESVREAHMALLPGVRQDPNPADWVPLLQEARAALAQGLESLEAALR